MACNIPVFRYALERWRPDAYRMIIFRESQLTAEQEQQIAAFTEEVGKLTTANVEVIQSTIGAETDKGRQLLWDSVSSRAGQQRPYVVLQTEVGGERLINAWHGPLSNVPLSSLINSPVRQEISERLLKGNAVVWLVVKSKTANEPSGPNSDITKRIQTKLNSLGPTLEFPEGLGLPGSELFSEIPLLMEFSVLEVDADDPREKHLVDLLKGFHPTAIQEGEALVVPVFGRGRALEVIPASRVDEDLVDGLTKYLCAACSCQVKEQNPGFDLLMNVAWDRELFGEDVEPPPPSPVNGAIDRPPINPPRHNC